jgi:F420-dependent oxidoreductase-like protein
MRVRSFDAIALCWATQDFDPSGRRWYVLCALSSIEIVRAKSMRIGLRLPSFTWPGGAPEIGSRLTDIARTADDAGFYSLWVMDHFFQIEFNGPPDNPMLEAYTTLGYLAGKTQHVKLGTLVTGVIYHYPGLLVKTVTTLDVISGGRAYFGVGAAWFEREAVGLGVPFPSTRERFEQLEETLQIARQMWAGKVVGYNGKHFHLEETINSPQAISKPHPPIIIGGMGEEKTLRQVAQYADGCNLFAHAGLNVVRHKLDVLKRHCDALGRPYEEIERTALTRFELAPGRTTVSDAMQSLRALAEAGIQHAILDLTNVQDITPIETVGREIIPAVADL